MAGLLTTTQNEYYANEFNSGNYQFTSLNDIINQFIIAYVGEGKIISKIKRPDVVFHAKRAMQELSFDTFKSIKSKELEVPSSLRTMLPLDYVNYTNISWSDGSGIQHTIYPASKTSNPINPYQNSDGDFSLIAIGTLDKTSSSIELDAEYKNIKVGMIVSGPFIPNGSRVNSTSNASSITTVSIEDGSGTGVLPTESNSGTTLTFKNQDGSLILKENSSHVVESLSWNTTDYKITASAAADITDIKIGMLVSHENFPIGTTVTNVYDTTVVVSDVPEPPAVASGGEVTFISPDSESDTWGSYKSTTPSENNNDDYEDDIYWPNRGERYGLDPQYAQVNGSFFIENGIIHFSSNISGKTVVLKYLSDGLGTDEEMLVHKFAEEAMYKWIAHAILSTRINTPEYIINRFKKERFAEIRKAKLRLSNIKLEELTQILRGKSKQIKH